MQLRPLIVEARSTCTPEDLVLRLGESPGAMLLRSSLTGAYGRYSFVSANPFLTFRSFGSRCELTSDGVVQIQFGNPWNLLDALMSRCELLDELDLPFPLGGCFGFWGYDLKNFVEPKLGCRAVNDLEFPDCTVGFYSSLVVFDHQLGKCWIISTGLCRDGARDPAKADRELEFWSDLVAGDNPAPLAQADSGSMEFHSTSTEDQFIRSVECAQEYIRLGHIYQVNLSHRLEADYTGSGWEFFLRLCEYSPAPFSAWFNFGDFELVSSSPELFLRLSGAYVQTRPIKGTRPRDPDPTRDAQLSYELQTSSKETAELVMITDLLRNDLGRYCEFGSIHVPDLMKLERYAHVQHLVSTVEGRLRDGVTHFQAFASSFPGGSVTGAPKIRAMQIIDELEPISRGPYTGALGYLGFNRESQLSIIIRTALKKEGKLYFNVGAGIVADSSPAAEWQETLAKGRGFMQALAPSRPPKIVRRI